MDINIAPIIAENLADWNITAQNFAKTRFLVNAEEFGSNADERAELMSISESITCSIINEGNTVSLQIDYGTSPYLDIIQGGMPAPETHGGGSIELPSGDQAPSNAVTSGVPLPWYSKAGEDVMGEVATMLHDLFKQAVQAAVSNSKDAIAEQVKTYLVPHELAAFGG